MKKKIGMIGVLMVLCMVMTTVFCSCSGGDLKTDIIGKWTLTSIITDGKTQTLAEYCEEQGVDSMGMEATYTFAEEGVVTATMGGVDVEGTYTIDGSTVTVTFNETPSNLTYDAGTLKAKDANTGIESVFKK